MEKFVASVQYNDWEGTVAADDSDDMSKTMEALLEASDDWEERNFLAGVDIYISDSGYVMLRGICCDKKDAEKASSGKVDFREVEVTLSLDQLAKLFKRLNIKISRHNLLRAE